MKNQLIFLVLLLVCLLLFVGLFGCPTNPPTKPITVGFEKCVSTCLKGTNDKAKCEEKCKKEECVSACIATYKDSTNCETTCSSSKIIPNNGSCGDGSCDDFEKFSGQCAKDCPTVEIATSGSCGDGTCDETETKTGMCPKDCNAKVAESACQYEYSEWTICSADGNQTRTYTITNSPCTSSQIVLSKNCTPPCTLNNFDFNLVPASCPTNEQQTKKYYKIGNCTGGTTQPTDTNISCTPQVTSQTSTKTELKMVEGVAKLYFNDAEFNLSGAILYNYPNLPNSKYGPEWVSGVKNVIDSERAVGTNFLLLHLWWSELDKSNSRPNNLGDNLDFTYADEVMDYAKEKGMKIMLIPAMHTMIPEWWKNENSMVSGTCVPKEKNQTKSCIPKDLCLKSEYCCTSEPADLVCCELSRNDNKAVINLTSDFEIFQCESSNNSKPYASCTSCETDDDGWKYRNPSHGDEKALADYTQYLTAVINHFKNNPALFGWQMQIGGTGEDGYGPDYISIQGMFNNGYGFNNNSAMVSKITDYSESFKLMFKNWLIEKYQTSAALKTAWGGTTYSFENFKIPPKTEFFVDGKEHPFPDNGLIPIIVTIDDLSTKGKDFYEFREAMKTKESTHYSALFKSLDPNHVLFFNSLGNYGEYNDSRINGYSLNWRLNADINQAYVQGLVYGLLSAKYNQYLLSTPENAMSVSLDPSGEDDAQLDLMKESGKAIKCFGLGFGHTAAFPGTQMPDWSSTKARQAILEINNYVPTEACKCEYLNKSYTELRKTSLQLLNIYGIHDYDYCSTNNNQNNSEEQNPCGDGTCDTQERSSGMCAEDCSS